MKYERSRLFVDAAFQGRLIFRLVMYWVIYHVALWHAVFLYSLISAAIGYDPAVATKSFGTLYWEFTTQHVAVILCFLAMLPILGRDLLKFSHRLAGPLVRFRNTMEQMAAGKPVQAVTLRRADLPNHFLATFNKLITVWNQRFSQSPAPSLEQEEQEL